MGCSQVNVELEDLDNPIHWDYINLSCPEVMLKFKESIKILKEIENIRELLIDKREKLVYQTGNCSLINNTLEGILNSFLMILATESKGNIEKYQIYYNKGEEPYFSISNSADINLQIASQLNNYISSLLNLEKKFEEIESSYLIIVDDFSKNYSIYSNLLDQNDMNEIESYNENLRILKYPTKNNILNKLKKFFTQDLSYLDKFPELLGSQEFIDSMNNIGSFCSSKGYFNNFMISYYGVSPECRFGDSWQEGKEYLEMRMKSKEIRN